MADSVVITLNKLFSLIFIFTVTAINLWLIGNFLYWKNVFSKDKKCILTSIALSDLLIGLFSLPVEATVYFEIYLGGPGCVLSYVKIYEYFFSPFVYGIGITILCMELILKSRGIFLCHINKFLTLFISLVPWLLAVIIVIPLVFSGTPSNSCWYLPYSNRGLCIWSITRFLPILLFLVTWMITAFVKWRPAPTIYSGASYSVWRENTNSDGQQSGGPASQSLVLDDRTEGQRSQGANFANIETAAVVDPSSNPPPIEFNRSPDSSSNPSGYHEAQQLITISSPPPQQGNIISGEQATTTAVQGENKAQDVKRETLYLLMIILVYVTVTVPFALYNLMKLSSYMYGSNYFTSLQTLTTLKWMQTARSLLIPMLWSIIYHIERCKVHSY